MLITEITLNKQTQSRTEISQETVAEYAEAMIEGDKFPALTVFFDGIQNYLVDGYHRYFAYKKAGAKDVDVKVMNGTLRDAVLYAVGVNDDHGLRRSNEDKRKAVMTLFNDMEWAEWSDAAIARKCKVSSAFVGRVRKVLDLDVTEKKYINKHGQEKTIKPVGKAPVVAPPQEDEAMKELAHANVELVEELAALKDRLALKVMDIPQEEKHSIEDTMAELRATIKTQEAEIHALKSSRDQLQAKNADMLKQLAYWKKQAEKAAA